MMSNSSRRPVTALMSSPAGSGRILAIAFRGCKRRARTTIAVCFLAGCSPDAHEPGAEPARTQSAALTSAGAAAVEYAGTAACLECHAEIGQRWRGSDHDLAMQPATPESVLGDFDSALATLDGQQWRFERRGDEFIARAPEEDGPKRDHRVEYTFGVRPLQQYLVRFPGGRFQPLPVAWDTRPREAGGQRWIHVYQGDGLRAGNPLHWTGKIQTWNHQCAACHTTALERGYDEASDRYDTRWAELDVGCEACHGPGSRHVELARSGGGDAASAHGLAVDLVRSPGRWEFAPDAAIAQRSQPAEHARREIDTCAPCHSRRARIDPEPVPGAPLLDGYLPALLDQGLYFADGRMRDEVYVWGSFLQSRMHAAGVSCSDCHDAHSLELSGGPDAACSTCHRPAVFATTEHHGHAPESAGASCVACHMPERIYMQVDARRDHSFRVPRPDIAALTGSPTVCASCHEERGAAWAASELARRGALRDEPHPAAAILAAWSDRANAGAALASVISNASEPAIVRATAASLIGRQLNHATLPALRAAVDDPDALVRVGALRALDALAPTDRLALARDRLRDPVRAVRIEAARTLLAVPPEAWAPGERTALADALGEYRRSQQIATDRVEAQLNLSMLEAQLGNRAAAIERAERARRLAPNQAPPFVNLADLLRAQGDEAEAERVLREGLAAQPASAEIRFALGLSLVRQGRSGEALATLEQAREHAPASSRIAYAYALALHAAERLDEAVGVLEDTTALHPSDRDVLVALATFERDRGRPDAAIRWADALVALDPADLRAQSLRRSLEPKPGS